MPEQKFSISAHDQESLDSIIRVLREFFGFYAPINLGWFTRGTSAAYVEVDYTPIEYCKTPELCTSIDYSLKLHHGLYSRHKRYIEEVIVPHEFCHLVCASRYGESIRPHGKEWKELMCQLGLPPDPYHDLDIVEMEYWKYRGVYLCKKCTRWNTLTWYMARYQRVCKFCGHRLRRIPDARYYFK